jgi:hypothetical protein
VSILTLRANAIKTCGERYKKEQCKWKNKEINNVKRWSKNKAQSEITTKYSCETTLGKHCKRAQRKM